MWSCRWAVLNLARPTSYRGAARLNLTKSPRNYCSSVESANHQPLKGMEQPFLYGSFRLPVTPWQLGVRTGCWLCRESWVELLRRILGGRTAEVMTRSRAPKRIKGKHNNLSHVYIYIYIHTYVYIYIHIIYASFAKVIPWYPKTASCGGGAKICQCDPQPTLHVLEYRLSVKQNIFACLHSLHLEQRHRHACFHLCNIDSHDKLLSHNRLFTI